MGRLRSIDPEQAEGRVREIFEGPLKGKAFNIFKAMANSPAVLDMYLGVAGALGKASLSDAEREVIQLAIAQANECTYCLGAHTQIAKGAGLSEEQTVQARRAQMDDPRLHAIATFARAIHDKRGWVDDEDVQRFREAGFDDGHIAEVVATYAMAMFTNYFNHVNQTEPDFPPAPEI